MTTVAEQILERLRNFADEIEKDLCTEKTPFHLPDVEPCTCGGKAGIVTLSGSVGVHWVLCQDCRRQTRLFSTASAAIEEWNLLTKRKREHESSTLKPCPFCGSTKIESSTDPRTGLLGVFKHIARCTTCDATTLLSTWNQRS